MTYTAHDIRKTYAYMTDAEIDALQRVVRLLPPNPVVINVGAGAGVSGLAIWQARDDITLWTVDVNKNSPLGCLEGELDAFRKAGVERDHPRHKQILGDSREVAKNWQNGVADLIFIDDGHSKNDITGDILGWLWYLESGGLMVFHDYGSNDWPAVREVVDEMMEGCKVVEYTDTLIAFEVRYDPSKPCRWQLPTPDSI